MTSAAVVTSWPNASRLPQVRGQLPYAARGVRVQDSIGDVCRPGKLQVRIRRLTCRNENLRIPHALARSRKGACRCSEKPLEIKARAPFGPGPLPVPATLGQGAAVGVR